MKELGKTNVRLVEIIESDLEEFYRIAKNKEVKQFVKILHPEDMEEAEIIIEMLTVDSNYIAYKILNEKEKFVGVIIGEKKGKGTVEISYFIAEEYRGNGYCTHAVVEFKKLLKKQKYKKTLAACYLGFITQAIAATIFPALLIAGLLVLNRRIKGSIRK